VIEEFREKIKNWKITLNCSTMNKIIRHDISNAITAQLYLELYKEEKNHSYLEKLKLSLNKCIEIIKNAKEIESAAKSGKMMAIVTFDSGTCLWHKIQSGLEENSLKRGGPTSEKIP